MTAIKTVRLLCDDDCDFMCEDFSNRRKKTLQYSTASGWIFFASRRRRFVLPFPCDALTTCSLASRHLEGHTHTLFICLTMEHWPEKARSCVLCALCESNESLFWLRAFRGGEGGVEGKLHPRLFAVDGAGGPGSPH